MKKIVFALLLSISFFFFPNFVGAAIYSSNLTGSEKNSFYTNETVYLYSDTNVTVSSASVRVYIVANSDSWSNGAILTGVVPYKTIVTNNTGFITTTTIWEPSTTAGSYDIVVDTGNDGYYNSSYDFIDSLTTIGFSVLTLPIPTLTFSLGENSPKNQNVNWGDNSQIVMMQVKAIVGTVENVILNSLQLLASGTGDDRTGIFIVRLYLDSNRNGIVDQGDSLLSYGKYTTNDGVLQLTIDNGYTISANSTAYFIITHSMTNSTSNGETYYFFFPSVSASSPSGTKVSVPGFTLTSATITIVGSQPVQVVQQILCSSYNNQTSCVNASCKWCESDNSCRNSTETCPVVCTGKPQLNLTSNETKITAMITGLSGCDGKIVYIKENSCDGNLSSSCSVTGSGCSVIFSSTEGNHTYYSCIDQNNNWVFETLEQNSQIISIIIPVTETEISQQPTFSLEEKSGLILLFFVVLISGAIICIAFYFIFRKKPQIVYEYGKLK